MRHGRNERGHDDTGGRGEPRKDACRDPQNADCGRVAHDGSKRIRQKIDPTSQNDDIHQHADTADQKKCPPGDAAKRCRFIRNIQKRQDSSDAEAGKSHIDMKEQDKDHHARDAYQYDDLLPRK